MQHVVVTKRFFIAWAVVGLLLLLAVLWSPLLYLAGVLAITVVGLCIYEGRLLRQVAGGCTVTRQVSDQLSLSDYQTIDYRIEGVKNDQVLVTVTDELPRQLQYRAAVVSDMPLSEQEHQLGLTIRPTMRGDYHFGTLRMYFVHRRPGLVQWCATYEQPQTVAVFPSVIQMRKFALMIFNQTASQRGVRRIRKVGENDEFEHLRQYQQGDNIKSINWKATSRKGELIVNQYQDTRSQQVYCLLDKGRTMEMPFDGMSLLDYSINTALTISNIALRKYDKAGLITFGTEVETSIAAENFPRQLEHISGALYRQTSAFAEAGFEALHHFLRLRVTRRSILFLFTNFEHESDLERALPYLRMINRKHLLIVISFRNAALDQAVDMPIKKDLDYYVQTLATDYKYHKIEIMKTLQLHGIQTIYTSPANLSIDVINKYLEIKARRLR